jgi:SAM-dependent methyltransferase
MTPSFPAYFRHTGLESPSKGTLFRDERDILWRIVRQRLGSKKLRRFLDVGAGDGYITEHVAQLACETVAVEPAERFRISLLARDIRSLSVLITRAEICVFAGRFDLVLLCHSVYYIHDWGGMVNRLRSLLSTTGTLLVLSQTGTGSFHDALNVVRRGAFPERDCAPFPHRNLISSGDAEPSADTFYFTLEMIFKSVECALGHVESLFINLKPEHKIRYEEELIHFLESHKTDDGVVLSDVQFGAEWMRQKALPKIAARQRTDQFQ